MFISFEGVDGSGKTTQIGRLSDALRNAGLDVVVTREPGGSAGAEEIRKLLVTGETDRWSARTEILLFTAARRDHLEKTVFPALEKGSVVISDRYVDSTRAYQGVRDPDLIDIVDNLHRSMIDFDTDRTFVLDIDPDRSMARGLRRLRSCASGEERFEAMGISFQHALRARYLDIAANGADRYRIIDADGGVEAVAERIIRQLPQQLLARIDNSQAIQPEMD